MRFRVYCGTLAQPRELRKPTRKWGFSLLFDVVPALRAERRVIG
jgi:hypothetical protein